MEFQEQAQEVSREEASRFLGPRAPVAVFFLIAYSLTWLILVPCLLARRGVLPEFLQWTGIIAKFGPSAAGLLMIVWCYGDRGLVRIAKDCLAIFVSLRWWLGCTLLPWLLVGLATWINEGSLKLVIPLGTTWIAHYFWGIVFHGLLGAGLGEELGWRGFALPYLQRRMSALSASVLIGVVWSFWHLPRMVFEPDAHLTDFIPYTIAVVFASILLTWVYNGTSASLALCIVLHGSINAASGWWGWVRGVEESGSSTGLWVMCALLLPLVAFVLVRFGLKTLSDRDAVTDDRYRPAPKRPWLETAPSWESPRDTLSTGANPAGISPDSSSPRREPPTKPDSTSPE